MKKRQAFKYQLRPDAAQQNLLRCFVGMARYVYNRALSVQKEAHTVGNKFINYVAMAKMLTLWRNSPETVWLYEAPVHILQQKLKDLDRAYKNFFKGLAAFPRFKKKGKNDSFRYPDEMQFKIDEPNSRVFLPKLGWVRYRNSRAIVGTPKNITVSQVCGQWFISIQTEC